MVMLVAIALLSLLTFDPINSASIGPWPVMHYGYPLVLTSVHVMPNQNTSTSSSCFCPNISNPMCGEDGDTHESFCHLHCAGTIVQCEGECPCKEPESGPGGCKEFCVPLVGPIPTQEPEPLPEECHKEGGGQSVDEDAVIQDSCNFLRASLMVAKLTNQREFCYQVCDLEHYPGVFRPVKKPIKQS